VYAARQVFLRGEPKDPDTPHLSVILANVKADARAAQRKFARHVSEHKCLLGDLID
jgi:hypothetical protein